MAHRILFVTLAVILGIGALSMVGLRVLSQREISAARERYEGSLADWRDSERNQSAAVERLHALVSNSNAVELEIRAQFRMIRPGERFAMIERE